MNKYFNLLPTSSAIMTSRGVGSGSQLRLVDDRGFDSGSVDPPKTTCGVVTRSMARAAAARECFLRQRRYPEAAFHVHRRLRNPAISSSSGDCGRIAETSVPVPGPIYGLRARLVLFFARAGSSSAHSVGTFAILEGQLGPGIGRDADRATSAMAGHLRGRYRNAADD